MPGRGGSGHKQDLWGSAVPRQRGWLGAGVLGWGPQDPEWGVGKGSALMCQTEARGAGNGNFWAALFIPCSSYKPISPSPLSGGKLKPQLVLVMASCGAEPGAVRSAPWAGGAGQGTGSSVGSQAWLGVALPGLGRRGSCPVEGTRARLGTAGAAQLWACWAGLLLVCAWRQWGAGLRPLRPLIVHSLASTGGLPVPPSRATSL